jgi:hypothetical protein
VEFQRRWQDHWGTIAKAMAVFPSILDLELWCCAHTAVDPICGCFGAQLGDRTEFLLFHAMGFAGERPGSGALMA